jgi:hypothetical protein
MTQPTLSPQSGTCRGGKVIKTICHPSYSLNTAMTDFLLFQRGEPFADTWWPHDEFKGCRPNHPQNEYAAIFWW